MIKFVDKFDRTTTMTDHRAMYSRKYIFASFRQANWWLLCMKGVKFKCSYFYNPYFSLLIRYHLWNNDKLAKKETIRYTCVSRNHMVHLNHNIFLIETYTMLYNHKIMCVYNGIKRNLKKKF